MSEAKTVAIIGAGPVGLAAAAHVLERGLEPHRARSRRPSATPCGNGAMCVCGAWLPRMPMFSPWEYNIDKAAERLLATTGWNSPEPDQYPTGAEMVERYLEPLATQPALKPHIHTSSRVTGISRVGFDKLKTKGPRTGAVRNPVPERERPEIVKADAVIDISGYLALAESGGREWSSRDRRERGRPTGSPTACPTYWATTARAMPARPSLCWVRAFRDRHADRSGKARRTKRRTPGRSGCCAAAILPRPLAAAQTTSWSPAVSSVQLSPR